MSKFLITGITGFAGPHLANLLLSAGHDVFGLVRGSNGNEADILDVVASKEFNKINFLYCDLVNKEGIENIINSNKFDGIFHLAAQSHPPTSFLFPESTFYTNAIGTMNIVNAIAKYSVTTSLLNCSTSEVYGAVDESRGKIDEKFLICPVNPYGVSKASADLYAIERAQSLGLRIFNTRAFSHTGPRRGYKFSISSDAFQIAKILSGVQEKKLRVGNLKSKRVVIDVRDCVRAYYLLMKHASGGESYNVGGSIVYSIGELLDKMLSKVNLKDVELVLDPKLFRPIDIPVQICNCDKLKRLTGWEEEYSIEKTLSDLIDYWLEKIKCTEF